MAWDSPTKQKCYGGLGLRKFEDINKTMLSKAAWELVIQPDKLCMVNLF